MKALFAIILALGAISCASKSGVDTTDARKELEERYTKRIGSATKSDLVQEFGSPNWCRPQTTGEESCRFYKKLGTKWMGDPNNRTHYDQFDELVVDFGTDGTMKGFKADAQR